MKFHQLAVGAEFIYQGRRCIKTSSIMASEVESGKPVFMKRSSEVEVDSPATENQQTKPSQAQQAMHDALQSYRAACMEVLRQSLPDAGDQWFEQINEKLEKARLDILRESTSRIT